jgi:peptidyl-prolyl cis-trans isomerase B (cyclophilin B)
VPPGDPEAERKIVEEILALEAVDLRALPGEVHLISAALRSPFPAVRARAARAAGRSPHFDDAALLAAFTREEDAPGILASSGPHAPVRLEAIIACGRIGGEAAVGALRVAAGGEPAPGGRAAAIAALSALPGATFDGWPSWVDEKDPLVGSQAAVRREAAFAAFRRPDLVPPDAWARFVAEEKDESVRWAIWFALARSPALRNGVDTASGAGDPNFLVSTYALEIPGIPPAKLLAIARDPRRFWIERDAALRALGAVLPSAAPADGAAIEDLLIGMGGSSPGPALPVPLRLRALSVLARARGESPLAAASRDRLAVLERLVAEEPGRPDAHRLAGILEGRAPGEWPLRLAALRAAEGLGRDGLPLLERAIDDAVGVVSRSAWLRWRRLAGADPPRPPRAGDALPYPFTPPLLAPRAPVIEITTDRGVLVTARHPRAEVAIEGKGTIILDLFAVEAPHHAASFMHLARSGFHAGRRIERVDAASGVVLSDARFEEGPVAGAPLPDESYPTLILRGTVFSLPAAGLPHDPSPAGRAPWTAAGSLAIAHMPLPELTGRAIVWGRVALGIEVLDRIVEGDRIERIEIRDRLLDSR